MQHDFELLPRLDKVDETTQALRVLVEPVIGPQQAVAFEVAVAEALTNVVVHGYDGMADDSSISINLTTSPTELRIQILDHGTPGPADLYDKAPPLDEIDFMQESGRGLALVRHHSDKAIYTPSAKGNQLVLLFHKPQASQPTEGSSGRGKDP